MLALTAVAACGSDQPGSDSADGVEADLVVDSEPAVESTPQSTTGSTMETSGPTSSAPGVTLEVAATEPEPTTTGTTGSSTETSAIVTVTTATVTAAPASTDGSGDEPGSPQEVRLHFQSMVDDVPTEALAAAALTILNDPRGWSQAGFRFVADDAGPYRVVLAEGDEVDRLCLPLQTYGTVSCQNGPVVALNADRWRGAVDHWVLPLDVYRGYLVNHEVGHLIGQRHPTPRCPVAGRPAGVMEQQTAGLEGCIGNPWPRPWELDYARQRPVVYAPLPAWGPDPVPTNRES